MKLLGVDYGERRVGLALSDDKSMMAFPHSVILNTKTLVSDIADIASKNDVQTIVIGESRNFKGADNRIMDKVRPFAEEIAKAGFKVHFESELLSSHQAAHFQGKTDMIDAAAASIILQSFIDRTNAAQLN